MELENGEEWSLQLSPSSVYSMEAIRSLNKQPRIPASVARGISSHAAKQIIANKAGLQDGNKTFSHLTLHTNPPGSSKGDDMCFLYSGSLCFKLNDYIHLMHNILSAVLLNLRDRVKQRCVFGCFLFLVSWKEKKTLGRDFWTAAKINSTAKARHCSPDQTLNKENHLR